MRDQEDIEKAYALAAQAAEELEEESPAEAAGPYILMKGLAWVLEEEPGEELFEDMEDEFNEYINE